MAIPSESETATILRTHCWNRAIESFGTSYIFQHRIRGPQRGIRWLTYLGLGVPLAIGLVVIGFGTDDRSLPYLLWIAGILLLVQGLLALWALVAKWSDTVESGLLSMTENNRLANRYKEIGERWPTDSPGKVTVLDAEYQVRTETDLRQGVSDQEKRMGLRAGLRQFQRACVGCSLVPNSMNPTECGVCGNFSRRLAK